MKPIIFFGKEININPIAFNILDVNVYWYGIIIVSAIAVVLFLLKYTLKDDKELNYNMITDFLVGAIISGFLCARLYYVLFKLEYYLLNPSEIFKIWHGGIAIYGGIIGAICYGIYFCKKKKIKLYKIADLLLPYLALAQSIGRWGNFVNREAYGYETSLPWKMGIYDELSKSYAYVHPTFIYESLATIIIFIVLKLVYKNKKFDGQITYLYLILYGTARFFIERLRTDSLMLGNIRVSAALSILLVTFSSIIYFYKINSCKTSNE